ncbi:MAG: TetR/AcrR family transcriptional regulator [Paucibacter sp.]|nr:TetR/AcrR family transcriptional regulator [Roseateles sp.]
MKVSKQQSAENREAILEAASRLFRERGIQGVGVAEIMAAAGFTHGGFYGHFASKEALAAEVIDRVYAHSTEKLVERLEGLGAAEHFRQYLHPHHRDRAGNGCPMPTLAADAAREMGPVSGASARGIAGYLRELACHRPDGTVVQAPDEADKARAILSLSALVGGMVLARATHEAAPELSDEILARLPAQLEQAWFTPA